LIKMWKLRDLLMILWSLMKQLVIVVPFKREIDTKKIIE